MKVKLYLLFMLATFNVVAQTEKGRTMIQFEESSYQNKYIYYIPQSARTKNTYSKFLLLYGKFIKDNNLLGLTVLGNVKYDNYLFQNSLNNPDEGIIIESNTTISPYFRRYIGNNKKFQLFSELMFNCTFSRNKSSLLSAINYDKSSGFKVNPTFGVGGNYFINNHLIFEANAKTDLMPINVNAINFSLIYLIGKKGSIFKSDSLNFNRSKKWVIGGGFGFNASKSNIGEQQSKNLSISAGQFINQKLFLGLDFHTINGRNDFLLTSKYYLYHTKFTPVLGGILNGKILKKSENNLIDTYVIFGLAYFINKNWFLESYLYSGNFNFNKVTETKTLFYVSHTGLQNIQLKFMF